MILYEPSTPPPLKEYGIDIPIAPDAVKLALDHLLNNPRFGPRREEWLRAAPAEPVTRELLELVHDPAYVARLLGEEAATEVIETYELIDRRGHYHRYDPQEGNRPLREIVDQALRTTAGSVACCDIALSRGACFFLGGGMHHGKRDTGDGFCLVNDPVIAAKQCISEGKAKRVWIVDLDVHKGDGTAALTAEDPSIRTFSIHMAHRWPLDRPTYRSDGSLHPSHIPSDVDVPVGEREEDAYLPLLEDGLQRMEEYGLPDLAIVLYGADPYDLDELPSSGGIRLTLRQMMERDSYVYTFFTEREVPLAYVKAGGYGNHAWEPLSQFLAYYLERELPGIPQRET